MKAVTVEQMRNLERRAIESGVAEDSLMEAAGLAIARRVGQLTDGVRGRRVLVLVGPGNNGGDGMVAARYLADWGALVTLYMAAAARREDKLEECEARRVRIVEGGDDHEGWALASYLPITDVVIDAVLGIGATRALQGKIAQALASIGEAQRGTGTMQVVAVDVPSGLDADTGEVDETTPYADLTLALGAPKVGLFRFPGAERAGRVETLAIGLPPGVDDDIALELIEDADAGRLLPRRRPDGHKGTFGRVVVVGGSRNFVGAPVLAASAAYRAGAGLVSLATPEGIYPLAAAQLPEATYLPLPEDGGFVAPKAAEAVLDAFAHASSAVVGPGLGGHERVERFVQGLLLNVPSMDTPLVIDADALNALAKMPAWEERLAQDAVLTPHPGEMARLMRISILDVQQDRVALASEAAVRWRQTVVLKGAHTVIASPDGRASISPFANPALASGGTGDVLAGVIGGLLAQGLGPYDAAVAGVHAHALAAERFRDDWGDSGLMAGDLLAHLPPVMRDLRAAARPAQSEPRA